MWIKARNGNWVPTDNDGVAAKALADGHEVFTTANDADPRGRGVKPVKWDPEASTAPAAEEEITE